MAGIGEGKRGRMVRGRRAWWLVLAVVFAGGLLWGGWVWRTGRRRAQAMVEIESEVMAGRHAAACRTLETLLAGRADPSGELLYLLGACERARGRRPAAYEAWARVAPGSAFSESAIRERLNLLLDAGRFAAAEQLINLEVEDPRNDRSAVRVLLVPMFRQLGRIEEAVRLIEDRWESLDASGAGALEPAIRLLRLHIELTLRAAPVEDVRTSLDAAARLVPDDDRVWLGRANLAIRTGARDEAERWLDACLRRRPDDVPVWRARFNWALADHRIDVVQEALRHLPAEASTPSGIHRLRAWLSSRRGDVESERRELEHLVVADPADSTALDRLAQRAKEDGQPARAAEWLGKKAEIARLRARYEKLYDRTQTSRDAIEMAGLAARLGRVFEARGFLTVAISEDPDREDLRHELRRMSRRSATVEERGRTLADVLAAGPGRSAEGGCSTVGAGHDHANRGF